MPLSLRLRVIRFEDLNSTNGTLVNRKPIKKHVLEHADVIEFGKYQLRYENTAQQKSSVQQHGFENTAVMRPAKLEVPKVRDDTKAEAEQAPPQVIKPAAMLSESVSNIPKIGRLQMLTGSNSGHEMRLNKVLTTFGELGVQVVVVTKRPHGYFLSHVEGEKPALINGQKLGSQAHELLERDVIELVGMTMEFYTA